MIKFSDLIKTLDMDAFEYRVMRQEGEGMNKKQLAQAGILAAMITGLLMYLIFFHGWLLIMGMCVSGMFACIFFLVALVWTKGAIIPNPYPHCCVVLKGRKEDE